MLWEAINNFWNWIIQIYNSFETLTTYNFTIGDLTINFFNLITTGLLTVLGLLLIKKLIR